MNRASTTIRARAQSIRLRRSTRFDPGTLAGAIVAFRGGAVGFTIFSVLSLAFAGGGYGSVSTVYAGLTAIAAAAFMAGVYVRDRQERLYDQLITDAFAHACSIALAEVADEMRARASRREEFRRQEFSDLVDALHEEALRLEPATYDQPTFEVAA